MEYQIQGNYGYGWECVNTETDKKNALRSLHEYESNEPRYSFRIVKVKITEAELNFTVEHVITYNIRKSQKWHRDMDKMESPYNPPQLAFYCFLNGRGEYRRYGYVASGNNKAIWRKTKKAAIEAYRKDYCHA